MTKREYLESIGYDNLFGIVYLKKYEGFYMTIDLSQKREALYVRVMDTIKSQQDISNLQIAFNNVRRDYEEMMKYKDEQL